MTGSCELVVAEAPLAACGFAAAMLQHQWRTRLEGGELEGPDGERTVLVLAPVEGITLTVPPEVEWLPRFPLLVARALSQGRKAWALGLDEAAGAAWAFEVKDDVCQWAERASGAGRETWSRADETAVDRAWRGDVASAAARALAAARVGATDLAGLRAALAAAEADPARSLREWLRRVGA